MHADMSADDDHGIARRRSRLVRRGFRRLLEDDPAIAVVGEASDGEEAIRLAGELKPRGRRHGLRDARDERARGDARRSCESRPTSPS